jgi:hypothetical protein
MNLLPLNFLGKIRILAGQSSVPAFVAVAVLSATAASHGATIVFQQGVSPDASYDMGGTDIRSNYTEQKFGGSGLMLVGSFGADQQNQPGIKAGFVRGVLEIDLTALKEAAAGRGLTVNSASLGLTVASVVGVSPANPIEIGLFTLAKDFDETTETGETYLPHSDGVTQVGTMTIDDSNPSVTFGSNTAFISAVNAALAERDNMLRLVLRASSDQESSEVFRFVRFFSDDATSKNTPEGAGDPSLRPALTIDYTVGLSTTR